MISQQISVQFQSSVNAILGHNVPFHEKKSQKSLFFECWLPYLLFNWLGDFVFSDDFPARSGKQPVSFRKLDQNCCCNEERNECVCFSGRSGAAIELPKVENTAFTIRSQFPCSQKHVSWLPQSCAKTHLGYTVPFYEKISQGRVFFDCWLLYL